MVALASPKLSPILSVIGDNFENFIDYRDKKICADNDNRSQKGSLLAGSSETVLAYRTTKAPACRHI
jgi:hypothetical protein